MADEKCCVEECEEFAIYEAWDNGQPYAETYNYYCEGCIRLAFNDAGTEFTVRKL